MNLSNVVLETPLIMEKSAFTSTAILYLQRQDSHGECCYTVVPSDDQFRPNYDRIKLKRLSVLNLSFCAICRSDIKYHNQRKALKCEHAFHTKCIKQWISLQKMCPICMIK
ncbi:RING finger protein 24 [Anopheles ziemanni]|uniref:RING finger protein 24 n=1 Tax=Anopheles coustani TaxID=139045 RepID=UPI00265A88FB|nr:RING finger protein 24 [Anopheles coustani]XP_058174512.1 RING finger protein 24 [Anopheles ziemanni]